jgi:hypothetical protein
MASFYEMDFGAFLKELNKLRRTKLSLKDADEWEDYFKSHKTGIIELSQRILKLENEIDMKVFDLYGLSEEQKRVVFE